MNKFKGISLLKKNMAFSFTGNIWVGLMGLVFVPLYIKFIGIESYGLIGIFAAFQGVFALLDMGLSTTLTREIARLSVLPGKEQEMRNLVRTMEMIYWGVAILIGIVVIILSPLIANHWIKTDQLNAKTVEEALQIMGFVMALQWPVSLYMGGLVGLQKHGLFNLINSAMSTFRGAGAVLILWLVSPTIQAFFLWQILINILNICFLAFFLWRQLPKSKAGATFQKQLIRGIWKFAAGISVITILSLILTQMDKIILSTLLSLKMFGYYTLANTVAMSLYSFIYPIISAVSPKIIQLVSQNDQIGINQLYHKSCQFLSVIVLPITAVVAMFSYEILLIWTKNSVTAENTHILLSLLICGTALHGLMNMPYTVQLAYGWTKLSIIGNFIAVILLVPMIVFMTYKFGAPGAASVWIILNSGYILFSIHFMHKRLLISEKWHWYWHDIVTPFGVSFLIAGLGRLLITGQSSQFIMILNLGIISICTLGAAAIATKTTREWVFNKILDFKLTLKN